MPSEALTTRDSIARHSRSSVLLSSGPLPLPLPLPNTPMRSFSLAAWAVLRATTRVSSRQAGRIMGGSSGSDQAAHDAIGHASTIGGLPP